MRNVAALEVRILRLEAGVAALTQDRAWIVSVLAGLAVELERAAS